MQEERQNNSPIKQNMLAYLASKGISQYQCYKDTGITRGVLSQPNGISEDNLSRFLEYYGDVSPEWIVTGQGDMLRPIERAKSEDITPIYKPKDPERVEELQYVPYLSFEATAGMLEQLDTSPEYEIGRIVVPHMPVCDGAVAITGDSMYPLLKSGDIVAFKVIHDIHNIHYGDMYLVAVDEDGDSYVAVKWVNKHPDDPSRAILVSLNEHYPPREVRLEHVRRLALIKFSIRYNSMG